MLQKKIIQNDYKYVTTKEGLETTNIDLTFIPYCEFQREVFARDWLLLGLFQLTVLRTLHPCSAKSLAGRGGRLSPAVIFFHSNQEKQHPGFHRSLILWSTELISAFVDRLIQQRRKKDSYLQDAQKYNPSFYRRCQSLHQHTTRRGRNHRMPRVRKFLKKCSILSRVTTICRSEEPLAYQRRIRPEQKKASNLDKTVDKGLKTKQSQTYAC